jgi:DNA-binding transcriptional ArsR family regulator/anti-sigma regulatory factor (Ser/Thr protein kinase)
VGLHSSTSELRLFIIQNVGEHPREISALTQRMLMISRQSVNRHLRKMVEENILRAQGNTRARRYSLAAEKLELAILLADPVEEHLVWQGHVAPQLKGLPDNVLGICEYGFTEMLNNVIDHSDGSRVKITVVRSPAFVEIWIVDDGIGIFRKIRDAFNLEHEQDAVLELSKGKLTTDPARHSGEGIFFSSRMFDKFGIASGTLFFCHMMDDSDWLLERVAERGGTAVEMTIDVCTPRRVGEVFDRFSSSDDDYAFQMTHVPLSLAKFGDENLVSRSQAKRVVRRFDRFKQVVLDFSDVTTVGQAFADEIFCVFQFAHPEVRVLSTNASPDVERMISRARARLGEMHERRAPGPAEQLDLI